MFTHLNLALFDKHGKKLPLNFKGDTTIAIKDDYRGSAIFLPIVESNGTSVEITGYKKLKGGRFADDSSVAKGMLLHDGEPIPVMVNVNKVALESEGMQTYTIDSIDMPAWPMEAYPEFPNNKFTQSVLFDRVSVSLHETQHFYIMAEIEDVDPETGKTVTVYKDFKSILSSPAGTYDDIKDWVERYHLLFFIDTREQKDFRIFTLNSDEVVWTDRFEVNLGNMDIPPRVNIDFSGENEGVYEQSLHVCLLDLEDEDPEYGVNIIPIGEIKMTAEAEGEDERYRTLFENFGIPDPLYFDHVYKDSYVEDDKPDFVSINKHSKEMFLAYDKIFPYVGTYKALINAVKLLGYDDIFFKEWYKVLGISNEVPRGYVAYNMAYKNEGLSDVISKLPLEKRLNLRKKNWLSMLFYLNREIYGAPDEYGFPGVEDFYDYRTEESLIKLISLREWLERYVMALNCKIIDIGGEGIYFERYKHEGYCGIQENISYDAGQNVIPMVMDASANDKTILIDSSAVISVKALAKIEERRIEEFDGVRLADLCDGYIDKDNIYHNKFDELPEDAQIFVGTTFTGLNNKNTYKLNAVSTLKNFIFNEEYFSEGSPRLIVSDNTVSFLASDIVNTEKNSAFTNMPVICLEKAVIKSFVDAWEKPVKYMVYPENNPETGVSYFIENKVNGKKEGSHDYIFLTPPTYIDSSDGVELTQRNGNNDSFTHNKRKHYNYTSDFDGIIEEYDSDDTTYGLRFSANNAYGIPLFSIQGYTLKRPLDFNIPISEEFYIDIIKGKMIFNDPQRKRKIYLIFDTDEKGKRTIEVKASYFSDEFEICLFNDSEKLFPYFIEGNEYQSFVDYYGENPNDAIWYNLMHQIKVYNSGEFSVALTVRDITGEVYCANAANKAHVLTLQPLLTAYTNESESNNEFARNGRNVDSSTVIDMYDPFCIFDYKVRNSVLYSGKDESNHVSYPIYPYNSNTANENDTAHYVNLSDRFKVVAYDAFISHEDRLDWNYYLILNRQNRKPGTRITEKNDIFCINDLYSGDPYVGVPGMATICPDLFNDSVRTGSENIDVTVLFYNEAGEFPVFQMPGKMVNAKVLDNLHTRVFSQYDYEPGAAYGYYPDEYHLLLSEDITDCYVWEDTNDPSRTPAIFVDGIYKTALSFEQDGVEWLLKSAFSDGYGSLWEYNYRPSYFNAEEIIGKRYAYSDIPKDAVNVSMFDITDEDWSIKEFEDEPWVSGWLTRDGSTNIVIDILPEITEDITFRTPAGHYPENEQDASIRFRVYSYGSEFGENAFFNPYYDIKPKLLIDHIPDYIKDPNIGIYIYPYWQAEIRIVGVGENRVLVQYERDILPRSFKKGEMVKLIWRTGDSSACISQSSYKVIGYDTLGLTLILEGEINEAYIVNAGRRYAYADIPSDLINYSHYGVTKEGWTPVEIEDEPWITGWLTYNNNPEFEYSYNPEDSTFVNSHLFPEESVAHTHKYKIPAGYYVDTEGNTHIRYRVFCHDDLGCPTGENEHGMFNPYYEILDGGADASLFISYAHNVFSDYIMPVKSGDVQETGIARVSHDLSYVNDKLTYYIDDTFKLVFRPFDTNNGVKYWMNSTNGKPAICDTSIYEYNCPVSVTEKFPNTAFTVDYRDFSDESQQTVLWKVYRSENASKKTLLFESWNKSLFLDIEELVYMT
jgi:hypothetical protein